jgi:hypothetical protein
LCLYAQPIKIIGTYDLNKNNLNEILILKDGGIQYVEIDDDSNHQELWYYHPNGIRSASIVDVVIANINQDPKPEIIAIISSPSIISDKKTPWLVAFKWTGRRFSSVPMELFDFPGEIDFLRPSNINFHQADSLSMFAVSFGSPSRKAAIFNLVEDFGTLSINEPKIIQPEILKNGYGRVYTALLTTNNGEMILIFSKENNILKTGIFSVNDGSEISSDLLVLEDKENLYAPDIWVHDITYNDEEGVLLPFQNDEVLMLSYLDNKLSLRQSEYSGKGLFNIPDTSSSEVINNTILKRIESGLYKILDEELSTESSIDQAAIDSLISNISKVDSIFVGDSTNIPATVDSAGGFYSFQWLVKPPMGTVYKPHTGKINWIPTDNQTGENIFAYLSQIRLGEKVLSVSTPFGKQHQIMPILSDSLFAFKLFVKDTLAPIIKYVPDEFIIPENRTASITLVTRDSAISRYHFDGEHYFELDVGYDLFKNNSQSVLTTSIRSNLSLVDRSVSSKLSFIRENIPDSSLTTISMDHDLINNTLNITTSNTYDSIPQSYSPEDWNPDWYLYPNYVFNGFPQTLSMDSINNNLQFKINEDLKAHPYTNISVTVPLGENFYTSAFSFPNEIYIKTIDVIITVDSLSRKSITATYEFYGKVSANSLAGVFDLKDRVRFNKQFLESKKLLKSTSLQTYTTSDDTSTIDSSITDSLSSDSTNLFNNTPSTSDSTLQNNNVVTQDSAAVLQGDSTSVVDPDSAAVLQGDSTSVVDPDSAAILQGDSTSVVDPDSAAVKIE